MFQHSRFAYLSCANNHDRFESLAHAQKFAFQLTLDIFHNFYLVQSKVNFILDGISNFVNGGYLFAFIKQINSLTTMTKTIIDPDSFHCNITVELKTGLQKISAACQI